MEKFKSGFVAIIGRTNVGKSTLLNNLVGEKVAITIDKSQTTRTQIRAIVNRKNSQIIFIDTPGIHKPKTKLGQIMNETAWQTIPDSDITIFMVDSRENKIGKGDSLILEKIKEKKKKTILILNKIDLIPKEQLLEKIEMYSKEYDFEAVIPISALDRKNVDIILDEIEKHLPYGIAYYNIDEYTDQTERQLVEETIREKALKFLDEEIPHGIYIEVDKMKLSNTTKGEEIYNIEAIIYVLRNSHKGIVIGKNGEMLKKIGTYARKDLERMLQIKINLKLWVKVKENWQENDSILKRFKTE